MSTYTEKLKDPRWQKKRLQVLDRDHWTCQDCGATDRTLHVHHLRYQKQGEPWDSPMGHLQTLCEPCHEIETRGRADYERCLVESVRNAGFTIDDLWLLAQCFTLTTTDRPLRDRATRKDIIARIGLILEDGGNRVLVEAVERTPEWLREIIDEADLKMNDVELEYISHSAPSVPADHSDVEESQS